MSQYPPASDSPSTATTYQGKCHCGTVSITVRLPKPLYIESDDTTTHRPSYAHTSLADCPVYKVNQCNCSACYKFGYVLVYPFRKDLTFHTQQTTSDNDNGKDENNNLSSYRFATKKSEHLFCRVCGTNIAIDFHLEDVVDKDEVAVNVKLLKGVDLSKCEWRYFDGKNKLNAHVNNETWS